MESFDEVSTIGLSKIDIAKLIGKNGSNLKAIKERFNLKHIYWNNEKCAIQLWGKDLDSAKDYIQKKLNLEDEVGAYSVCFRKIPCDLLEIVIGSDMLNHYKSIRSVYFDYETKRLSLIGDVSDINDIIMYIKKLINYVQNRERRDSDSCSSA